MRIPLRLALLGSLALGLGAAHAQGTATTPSTTPATGTPATGTVAPGTPATGTVAPATRTPGDSTALVDASALEAGANSFTEGQARSRLEDAGFTAIEGLAKDDQGFWRGRGMRGGQVSELALDFRGRIAAGTTLGALGSAATRGSATTGTTTLTPSARPDGTPGNPPSTAVGRGVDQLQGQPSRPDGTPGNPPGTAAGRALDRATGTNPTGTNPTGTNPTGTTPPANR